MKGFRFYELSRHVAIKKGLLKLCRGLKFNLDIDRFSLALLVNLNFFFTKKGNVNQVNLKKYKVLCNQKNIFQNSMFTFFSWENAT